MLAGGDNLDCSTVYGKCLVGTDALASCAGALAVERTTVHHEYAVGFHSGASAHVLLVGVIFACAGGDGDSPSAVYLHQSVAAQALACCGGSLHVYHSTFYIYGIVALDGIAGRGFHIDIVAGTEHHVVVAAYACLAVSIDPERTAAGEEHFALAEEAGFHVLVVGLVGIGRTVGEGVGRSVGKHNVAALLALDVNGRTVRVCYVSAVQLQLKLVVAVDFEKTVGCDAAHNVVYLLDC